MSCYTVDVTLSVSPVKEKAKARGIKSAAELARQTGLSYPTIHKWWTDGLTMIDMKTLAVFADFFDCEPGELIARL